MLLDLCVQAVPLLFGHASKFNRWTVRNEQSEWQEAASLITDQQTQTTFFKSRVSGGWGRDARDALSRTSLEENPSRYGSWSL